MFIVTVVPSLFNHIGRALSLWHTTVEVLDVRSEFLGKNIELFKEEKAMPPTGDNGDTLPMHRVRHM